MVKRKTPAKIAKEPQLHPRIESSSFVKIVVWLLMGFLVLVFVLSFIMQEIVDVSRDASILGKFDGRPIVARRYTDFYSSYEEIKRYIPYADEEILTSYAFENLISFWALSQYATEHYFYVGDKEYKEKLVRDIYAEGGDVKAINQALSLNEKNLVELRLRSQMIVSKLKNVLFTYVPVSKREVAFSSQVATIQKKTKALYWAIDYNSLVDTKALEAYYKKNKKNYESYSDFKGAEAVVKADYVNGNSRELKGIFRDHLRNAYDKMQGSSKSLEEIQKNLKGEFYQTDFYGFGDGKIIFVGSDASSKITREVLTGETWDLGIGKRSDILEVPSGLVMVETVDQKMGEVVAEDNIGPDALNRFAETKRSRWEKELSDHLIKQHNIKRNFK